MSETISIWNDNNEPLAERLRPTSIDEIVGQDHLLGKGKILRNMIESDKVPSMIFWGPPGVGKTTIAKVIASMTKADFITFSAVTSGIKEIKTVMEEAEKNRLFGGKTIVFVDEIHRFNKAQQDAFLPFVEKGSIILVGATTENPSFEINNALLSRCKVFVLNPLTVDDIVLLLKKAISDKRGFGGMKIKISKQILETIATFSNGDARGALSTLEMVILNGDRQDDTITVSKEIVEQVTSKKSFLYDKKGEEHYNLISALHKSMRNSDPDAAVYWLARMLEAGEDPLYIARRVVRFASEDVGLTEAVVYMAMSPKSNAMEVAYNRAAEDAKKMIDEPVPMVIRNAPTKLMKELGYGDGYIYAHDTKEKISSMQCLPDSLVGKEYFTPGNQGLEAKYKARLEEIKKWKEAHSKKQK